MSEKFFMQKLIKLTELSPPFKIIMLFSYLLNNQLVQLHAYIYCVGIFCTRPKKNKNNMSCTKLMTVTW